MLDRDALTVVSIEQLGGSLDTPVPAIAVLFALDLVSGTVAVWVPAQTGRSSVA